MKRIVAMLLVVLCIGTISAAAESVNISDVTESSKMLKVGDINKDGKISAIDAYLLQQIIACSHSVEIDGITYKDIDNYEGTYVYKIYLLMADVNNTNTVTARDVFAIQRYCTGFRDGTDVGKVRVYSVN